MPICLAHPLGPLHTSTRNTRARTQLCSGEILMQIRTSDTACHQTASANIPKMLDAITKPSDDGSAWQRSPARPQTRCHHHNFEGETSPQLENQVLCMDLAPRKQVAQDAVGFQEDSGSQCPFPRSEGRGGSPERVS